MIVTPKQLAAMRNGKATVAYVPATRAADWKAGKRVLLYKLVDRAEQCRTTVMLRELDGPEKGTPIGLTVTTVSDPFPFEDVSPRDAVRAGFKTLGELRDLRLEVLTARERRDLVVAVRFDMHADRPKMLADGPRNTKFTGDYTRSRSRAMRGEQEVLA
jgi:hypothetical protein